MGNKGWILQVIFFTIVPYTILISLRNSRALVVTGRNVPRTKLLITIRNISFNTSENTKDTAELVKINKTAIDKFIDSKTKNLTKDGIFWSDFAESSVPKGLSINDSLMLIKKLREQNVISLEEGTSKMCGTSKGGIVTLQNRVVLCAKYKRKQRSVHAEVLSYYLSRLLNMDNIPEVFLSSTDPTSNRWKRVDPSDLDWDDDEVAALVSWQKDCRYRTVMPTIIQEAYLKQQPITGKVINNSELLQTNTSQLAETIQWGTIIIFDDLIGHFDRLVRAERDGDKKEYDIQTSTLHNSVKSPDGKIWLIDHESAFFYRYKYYESTYNYIRIIPFYDRILKTMCVFQSQFIEGLQKLSDQSSPFESLWNFTLSHEPLLETIPKDLRSKKYAIIFNFRLKQIMEWIRNCRFSV